MECLILMRLQESCLVSCQVPFPVLQQYSWQIGREWEFERSYCSRIVSELVELLSCWLLYRSH